MMRLARSAREKTRASELHIRDRQTAMISPFWTAPSGISLLPLNCSPFPFSHVGYPPRDSTDGRCWNLLANCDHRSGVDPVKHCAASFVSPCPARSLCAGFRPPAGSLSDRVLIAENRCVAFFVSTVHRNAETRSPLQRVHPVSVDRARGHADPDPYMDKVPDPFRWRMSIGTKSRARTFIAAEHSSQQMCTRRLLDRQTLTP